MDPSIVILLNDDEVFSSILYTSPKTSVDFELGLNLYHHCTLLSAG